jgi:hypothetical protein
MPSLLLGLTPELSDLDQTGHLSRELDLSQISTAFKMNMSEDTVILTLINAIVSTWPAGIPRTYMRNTTWVEIIIADDKSLLYTQTRNTWGDG